MIQFIIGLIFIFSVWAFFDGAFELKPSNTPWHWWVIGGGITFIVMSIVQLKFDRRKKDARFKSGYKDNMVKGKG